MIRLNSFAFHMQMIAVFIGHFLSVYLYDRRPYALLGTESVRWRWRWRYICNMNQTVVTFVLNVPFSKRFYEMKIDYLHILYRKTFNFSTYPDHCLSWFLYRFDHLLLWKKMITTCASTWGYRTDYKHLIHWVRMKYYFISSRGTPSPFKKITFTTLIVRFAT